MPVTSPELLTTEAMPLLLLLHVPPTKEGEKPANAPTQIGEDPMMLVVAGSAITVIVRTLGQLAFSV
jgi:hypothetical protein